MKVGFIAAGVSRLMAQWVAAIPALLPIKILLLLSNGSREIDLFVFQLDATLLSLFLAVLLVVFIVIFRLDKSLHKGFETGKIQTNLSLLHRYQSSASFPNYEPVILYTNFFINGVLALSSLLFASDYYLLLIVLNFLCLSLFSSFIRKNFLVVLLTVSFAYLWGDMIINSEGFSIFPMILAFIALRFCAKDLTD